MDTTRRLLIDIREASEYLHISKSKLYSMVEHKEIPHVRVRAAIRFLVPSLEQWAKNLMVDAIGSPGVVDTEAPSLVFPPGGSPKILPVSKTASESRAFSIGEGQ